MKKISRTGHAVMAAVLAGAVIIGSGSVQAQAAAKTKTVKTVKTVKVSVTSGTKKKLKASKKLGRKLKWSSSNKKVVSVNKKGQITAKKKGSAMITAVSGKKKQVFKVKVNAPKKLKLSQKKLSLKPGEIVTLTVKNAGGAKIKWKSSAKKIATIDKGQVVAQKAGKAVITASVSGKKFTCTVKVLQDKKASGTVDKGNDTSSQGSSSASDKGSSSQNSQSTSTATGSGSSSSQGSSSASDKGAVSAGTASGTVNKVPPTTGTTEAPSKEQCSHDMQPVTKTREVKVVDAGEQTETGYKNIVYKQCKCGEMFLIGDEEDAASYEACRKAVKAWGDHQDEIVCPLQKKAVEARDKLKAIEDNHKELSKEELEALPEYKEATAEHNTAVEASVAAGQAHAGYHEECVPDYTRPYTKVVVPEKSHMETVTTVVGYKCSKCGYTSKTK